MTMPALGESVTEGTVTRWLKAVGDEVTADEPLLEVSTDKVDTEIPAPVSGTLLEITVNEDETVDVGAQLAVIGAGRRRRPPRRPAAGAAQQAPEPEPAARRAGAADRLAEPAAPSTGQPGGDYGPAAPHRPRPDARLAAGGGARSAAGPRSSRRRRRRLRHPAGPPARRRARRRPELGHRHRRRRADPQAGRARGRREGRRPGRAAAPLRRRPRRTPSPAATPDTSVRGRTEKLSRLRAVIARRMVESLQVSAQLTTVVEADVTQIARLRQQAKADFEAREGVKLSFLPFFAKAAIEALKAHPSVNSSIDQEAGTVTYHDTENLGIAVDTERGLLVPVIHEAGDLSLGGIARKIADLAERTRTNKITPDELGGGTFTLTNTGSRGALFDTPIINQPQVAILGVGSVVKRPVVVQDPDLGEVIAIRSMVYLALTYDHRIVDGADAARFLTTVRERLEAGQFEGELGLA